VYSGDDHTFVESIFEDYLDRLPEERISIVQQSKARAEHAWERSKINPDMYLNETLLQGSLLESVLILSVFGDPISGGARKDWVEAFFRKSSAIVDS